MDKLKIILSENKKWIVLLGIVAFLYAIFGIDTSVSKKAITEVKKATNKEQVQKTWDKYIGEINTPKGEEKFIAAIKNKLDKMDLSDEEISHWHNQFKIASNDDIKPNLNIIVIPDLSHRIIELPHSENYDKQIISEIYKTFFTKAKNHKSKDKLVIEVADNSQVSGLFREIAENLTIDMGERRNNENARKYLEVKEKALTENLDRLYTEARKQTSGADYVYYFSRIAPSRIRKSDIHHEYINKIIILTDGYLETNDRTYTETKEGLENALKTAINNGNLEEVMNNNNLTIPRSRHTLPNTEVLVLEITERQRGIGWHKEVLEQYWKDWFKSMGVKNINNNNFFQLHNNNVNETKKIVNEFLTIK